MTPTKHPTNAEGIINVHQYGKYVKAFKK